MKNKKPILIAGIFLTLLCLGLWGSSHSYAWGPPSDHNEQIKIKCDATPWPYDDKSSIGNSELNKYESIVYLESIISKAYHRIRVILSSTFQPPQKKEENSNEKSSNKR